MATKKIDSFSVFLETVDEGVRSAKTRSVGPETNGLPGSARVVLAGLRAAPGGSVPPEELRSDLGLGLLEFADAVSDLVERGLVVLSRNGTAEVLTLPSSSLD
jgi:hypothetical protein